MKKKILVLVLVIFLSGFSSVMAQEPPVEILCDTNYSVAFLVPQSSDSPRNWKTFLADTYADQTGIMLDLDDSNYICSYRDHLGNRPLNVTFRSYIDKHTCDYDRNVGYFYVGDSLGMGYVLVQMPPGIASQYCGITGSVSLPSFLFETCVEQEFVRAGERFRQNIDCTETKISN